MRTGPAAARRTAATLGEVLDRTLRLLHPVAPFVTETLYERLRTARAKAGFAGAGDEVLARADFPAGDSPRDEALESRFEALRELVTSVRRLRADAGLAPDQALPVAVRETEDFPGLGTLLRDTAGPVGSLGRMAPLRVVAPEESWPPSGGGRVSLVERRFEASVELGAAADPAALRERVALQRRRAAADREKLGKRLASPRFRERADPAVVRESEERAAALAAQEARLGALLSRMAAETPE